EWEDKANERQQTFGKAHFTQHLRQVGGGHKVTGRIRRSVLNHILAIAREERDPQVAIDRFLNELDGAISQAVEHASHVEGIDLFAVSAVPDDRAAVSRLVYGVPVFILGPAEASLGQGARPTPSPSGRCLAVIVADGTP